ncbi:MAG: hypothetical protein BGO90_02820, partial [Legionella sp. 40-6]
MLNGALILLLIGVVFGIGILISLVESKPLNKTLLYLHGVVVFTAIGLMAVYLLLFSTSPLLLASLMLLIMAAIGGFTLFILGKKGRPIPIWLTIIHPLLAMMGVIC